MKTYPRVVKFITEHPWAILPEKLDAIADFLSIRLSHEPSAWQEEPEAAAPAYTYERAGSVAVMQIMGTVAKRSNMLSYSSGGFSVERFTRDFRAAMNDPDVGSILLQIDSPGGSVYGVEELAEEIYQARARKTIVAQADDLAASAAYWIGSAATEFVVTPSGEVGSIGVVAMHVDYSKAIENEGVAVTYVHAGENKVEGNPYQPLSEDARGYMQSRIDEYYSKFTKAVARGRNTSVANVNKTFGQGRVFGAEQAKAIGMVDRVATMTETIERMQPKKRRYSQAAAHIAIARAQAS